MDKNKSSFKRALAKLKNTLASAAVRAAVVASPERVKYPVEPFTDCVLFGADHSIAQYPLSLLNP